MAKRNVKTESIPDIAVEQATESIELAEKPEKVEICCSMMEGLKAIGVEEFTINNPEREFVFHHNGTKYKVTLACPRS